MASRKKRIARRTKRSVNKEVNKSLGKLLLVAVVTVILVIAIALTLQIQPTQPTQPYIPVGQGNNYKVASEGTGCKTNIECFIASCKSKPTMVNCINATAQDFYYVNCNSYVDVSVTRDSTKCACVQSTCKMIG